MNEYKKIKIRVFRILFYFIIKEKNMRTGTKLIYIGIISMMLGIGIIIITNNSFWENTIDQVKRIADLRQNVELNQIIISDQGGLLVVTPVNLKSNLIPLVGGLEDWAKSRNAQFLLIGGKLTYDETGEVIWCDAGKATTLSVVTDKVGTKGVIIVNNPQNIKVRECFVSNGTLNIQRTENRYMGFLWKNDEFSTRMIATNLDGLVNEATKEAIFTLIE